MKIDIETYPTSYMTMFFIYIKNKAKTGYVNSGKSQSGTRTKLIKTLEEQEQN